MKAILEFELPEDKENFNASAKGMDWAIVVWDLDQILRNKLKHGDLFPNTRVELEQVRDALTEMLIERGLQYPA